MYITVQLPQGVQHYTDRWFLDPRDSSLGLAVAGLCAGICAEVGLSGSWKLQLNGADLSTNALCWDVLNTQDVVTLIEA